MTYEGHIENGVPILSTPVDLPNGTPVRVEVERVDADFWRGKSVEELTQEQGVKPCVDPDDLAGEWPENESIDDFLAMIRRSRH